MGILSSIGIGSATVDLVLPSDRLTPGESADGYVDVRGGNEEQAVDGIYFALRTYYRTDEGRHPATVTEFALEEGFTIGPGEDTRFDVTVPVPVETPATVFGATSVWIDTGLDIDWAADPEDKDEVTVTPHPTLDAVHQALGTIGFELETAAPVVATGTPFAESREFVQEFEYRPASAPYRAELEELEVVANPTDAGVDLELEVDLVDTLLADRERRSTLTVTATEPDAVVERIRPSIDRHL